MDEIIGISILQPTWVPGIFRLWFTARKGNGERSQGWIFIRDGTSAGLPAKFPDYPDGCNSIWKFSRTGPRLDCAPSVNWISWGFHNAGQWSTDYLEMTEAERAESKAGPEPTRYARASSVHYDLNLPDSSPDYQHEFIAELRAQGVLK